MERLFSVTTARFDMRTSGRYLLTGYFPGNSIAGKRMRAFLDGKELELQATVQEGFAIRQKYARLGIGPEVVDREYDLWITLPEGFEKGRKLKVYQYQDEKRKCIFSAGIKKLLKRKKLPDSYLEGCREREGIVTISGWAVGNSPCRVQVLDGAGKKLEASVSWHARQDILEDYPELPSEENQVGFQISFPKPGDGNIRLIIAADGQSMTYPIDFQKLSRFFGGGKDSYYMKIKQYLKKNGLKRTVRYCLQKLKARYREKGVDYSKWRRAHLPGREELEAQRKSSFLYQPLISIVVPLYQTPLEYLRALVESVENQTYHNWELCLSDGSGADSPLKDYLEELESREPRVKVIASQHPLGISENTNAALAAAKGAYIAFADHDDLLAEYALYECVKMMNEYPDVDMIYSDEDKITMDGKKYFQPHFKSDYNPDLLCSMNYICHLVVVKRELQQRVGLLDPAYDGAQDYDFVLRCTEQAEDICHVPRVLYHWRAHQDSTAENPASKRYAFEAGMRAVQAHYDRMGIPARVVMGEYPGLYRTYYGIPKPEPLISVIIPNKDHTEDLDKCLRSIRDKSRYPSLEFIIIENNSTEEKTFSYYRMLEVAHPNVRVVHWDGEFNYSRINNFGVQYAKGEYLLFLNNDTEIRNPDCLEELLGPCLRADVGAVGARLYYGDGTIQHAGVVIGFGGIAGHAFAGSPGNDNGYFSRIICAADVSAVTAACMMVKRSVFETVGGFDEELAVAFNDIDFCLKIRSLGGLVVYNPYAEAYHYESKSRGYEDTPEKIARFHREADEFLKRWPDILQEGDPYYNPNLTLEKADFSLKV